MAALAVDVTNSIWHAFNSLDDQKNGLVSKSKLKVLTANLGTLLQCLNVEKGLQDHRSTPYLKFDDYMFYLQKELFTSSPCTLENQELKQYRDQIEEVCWLVCRKQFLRRETAAFPDACVYQLFRVFCSLAEMTSCPNQIVQVILPAQEVCYITKAFVVALGHEWDQDDFEQIARVIPVFKFPVFLALLETRHAKNVEKAGLTEAVQELYDVFIKDVIKKGFLYKRGQFLPSWKEGWFILQPNCLSYYTSRSEKEKGGEIALNYKCTIDNIPEMPNMRSNRFAITSQEKCFEFSASDHKTKLQWISAIQTAIEHSGMKETYQKRLSCRRKAERETAEQRRSEEEHKQQYQQQLLQKQQAELEAEKLARQAAEQRVQEQTQLRMAEVQRMKELEMGKKELERLLEEERQAKHDEEVVRNLQARVLREEWEKREDLERLQKEQSHLLEEERNKRAGLEAQTQNNKTQLEEALRKLKQLEEERQQLDSQLKDAQQKMVAAERAKDILEAKLKARERSFIPVPTKTTAANKSSSDTLKKKLPSNSQQLSKGEYVPNDISDLKVTH